MKSITYSAKLTVAALFFGFEYIATRPWFLITLFAILGIVCAFLDFAAIADITARK